jgi:hypothetical protein
MVSISANETVPDRLRGAGLVMLAGGLPWVLMPFASLVGGDVSGGIGITVGASSVVVTTAMLPWLVPLSVATAVGGLLVYHGRGLDLGMALAVAWIAVGLASMSFACVIAIVVAYCIFTGRRLALGSGRPGVAVRQYTDLSENPRGSLPDRCTGVSCPIGLGVEATAAD